MKTPVAFVSTALLLGGCGMHMHHPHHADRLGAELHQRPLVYVKEGLISISPEPVVFRASAGDKAITWRLPAGTRFHGAGIVLKGRLVDVKGEPLPPTQKALEAKDTRVDDRGARAFTCQVAADQQSATCTPQGKDAMPGIYKYVISVVHQGKPLTWDPNILHLD